MGRHELVRQDSPTTKSERKNSLTTKPHLRHSTFPFCRFFITTFSVDSSINSLHHDHLPLAWIQCVLTYSLRITSCNPTAELLPQQFRLGIVWTTRLAAFRLHCDYATSCRTLPLKSKSNKNTDLASVNV